MGTLATDTVLQRSADGRLRCELSADWEAWGPNGGYLAAVLLRAAGEVSPLPRPASLSCHFLAPARSATLDLEVVTTRAGKTAHCVRVTGRQGGTPVVEASVWTVGDVDGLEHLRTPAPEVPPVEDVPVVGDGWGTALARNLEGRPITWSDEWPPRTRLDPFQQTWWRFLGNVDRDPFVDAGRAAVLVDMLAWPAVVRAHFGEPPYWAPTLALGVRFYASPCPDPWLLCEARSEVATAGLIDGDVDVWDSSGGLVARGSVQLLCRSLARSGQASG